MIWLPTSAATQILLIFDFVRRADAGLRRLRRISAVAEVESTPIAVPLGSVRLPQPDFFGDQFGDAFHAFGIMPGGARRVHRGSRLAQRHCGIEKRQAEFDRILTRRVGQLSMKL